MGFSTPPLQFYNMNYYPLYSGGPVINGSDRANFNSNSSFYTADTQYSVPFGVNMATQNRTGDSFYYSLNSDGSLNQKSLASLNPSSQSYSIDSNGAVQKASTPSTAPTSPTAYQDYLKALSISDYNFADLLTQPSFQLSNVGIGLEVTTDGFGNIDNVKLDPAIQAIASKAGAIDPSFAFLNRYEALVGALQNLSPAADIVQENTGQKPVSLTKPTNSVNPFAQLNNTQPLSQNLKLDNLNNPFGQNRILDRLRSVQPQTAGTKLTGAQAELGGYKPQAVATAKAGFDVRISPEIQNVIASVIQKNQAHHASQLNPHQMARAVDGTIPMVPSLPAVADARSQGLNMASGQNSTGLEGFETATEKKGSGGYVPFSMAHGGSQGFESGMGMGQGLGQQMGQQQQNQQGQQQHTFGQNAENRDLWYKPLQFFA